MYEKSEIFNSNSVPTYCTRTITNKRTVPTYRTRTITKKAYRTNVPYLLAKIEAYRTVPYCHSCQGHKHKCSKKKGLYKNFSGDLQKKKVFTKIFQAISTKKRFPKNFSNAPQNFNNSKNSAVLEPRTGQFLRT